MNPLTQMLGCDGLKLVEIHYRLPVGLYDAITRPQTRGTGGATSVDRRHHSERSRRTIEKDNVE